MGGDNSSSTNKNQKKANLLDHHSIKHILDESVTEIVSSRGYPEDVRLSNVRLLLGTIIIVIALFAQFYRKKFPENMNFLIGCITLYIIFNGILQLIIYTKEKNAILFTYPPEDFWKTYQEYQQWSQMDRAQVQSRSSHPENLMPLQSVVS